MKSVAIGFSVALVFLLQSNDASALKCKADMRNPFERYDAASDVVVARVQKVLYRENEPELNRVAKVLVKQVWKTNSKISEGLEAEVYFAYPIYHECRRVDGGVDLRAGNDYLFYLERLKLPDGEVRLTTANRTGTKLVAVARSTSELKILDGLVAGKSRKDLERYLPGNKGTGEVRGKE